MSRRIADRYVVVDREHTSFATQDEALANLYDRLEVETMRALAKDDWGGPEWWGVTLCAVDDRTEEWTDIAAGAALVALVAGWRLAQVGEAA